MIRRFRKYAVAWGAAALGAAALPSAALAQGVADTSMIVVAPNLQRSDAAGARIEPGFMPRAVAVAGLLVEPSLSAVGGYDSNVFNFTDAQGDAVLLLTPRMRVRTDATRHLLQIDSVAQLRRFTELTTENSEEFRITSLARLDIADRDTISLTGSIERQIEPRSTFATVPDAANPVTFGLMQAQVVGDFWLGRLAVRPAAFASQTAFRDVALLGGGVSEQDFRDLRTYGGAISLGYRFSDLAMLFAQGRYADAVSTNPIAGAERDSIDLMVTGGVRGQISPLVMAEVAIGYRKRDFAQAIFLDFEGLTYQADIEWYVTPLITLTAEAEQDFLNSGILEVAGILSNRFALSAFYDPLRNLRVSASAMFERFNFRETESRASRPAARIAAQYFLSRHLSLGGFAAYRAQIGNEQEFVRDFTALSVGVGITLTPS